MVLYAPFLLSPLFMAKGTGKKPAYQNSKEVESQTRRKIDNLDIQIVNIRLRLEKALDVLHIHEQTISNKQEYYDEWEKLKTDNPLLAHAFDKKRKLNFTLDRKRKKEFEIEELEQQLDELVELQRQLRVDIKRMLTFDPLHAQLNNPDLDKHFFFAGTRYWKPYNSEAEGEDRRGMMRNSRFKTYQDIFVSHHSYRIRPTREGMYWDGHEDTIPLKHCIVDPSRFTDKFLRQFGLADLSGELTPLQKMEVKTEAIPKVAGFFEHLQPMPELKKGKTKRNYRLYVLEDYDPAHDGKIIYPKYTGTLPGDEDNKTVRVFQDIYSTRRSAEYTANNLDDKGAKILDVEIFVRQIHKDVLEIRKDDPEKEEKKEKAREKLARAFDNLKKATNFRGRRAAKILKRISDLKDRLGRDNPGAVCAQLLGAIDEIKERYPQVVSKRKHSLKDCTLLSRKISEHERDMGFYFEGFNKVCDKLVSAQASVVFKDVPEERVGNQRQYTTNAILKPLGDLPDLENLNVRPFNLYAIKLEEKKRLIEEGVFERDIEKARNEAIKAFIISKIFQVQKQLEEITRDIAVRGSTDWADLHERTSHVKDIANEREVFPEIEVESYKSVYEIELVQKIQDVIDFIEGLFESSDEDSNEELKKELEKIDFSGILSKLD